MKQRPGQFRLDYMYSNTTESHSVHLLPRVTAAGGSRAGGPGHHPMRVDTYRTLGRRPAHPVIGGISSSQFSVCRGGGGGGGGGVTYVADLSTRGTEEGTLEPLTSR